MYTLEGCDGNAFSLMGYTSRALKETGNKEYIRQMQKEATSDDYNNLIRVCLRYLDLANGKDNIPLQS